MKCSRGHFKMSDAAHYVTYIATGVRIGDSRHFPGGATD
jgi:hypothetical protein